MSSNWSTWKRFPDAKQGDATEAPTGAGVYEVRHVMSGRLVAFGHTAQVTKSLSAIVSPAPSLFSFLRTEKPSYRSADLEYRTCAAATRKDARTIADGMLGRRQVYWRRAVFASAG